MRYCLLAWRAIFGLFLDSFFWTITKTFRGTVGTSAFAHGSCLYFTSSTCSTALCNFLTGSSKTWTLLQYEPLCTFTVKKEKVGQLKISTQLTNKILSLVIKLNILGFVLS